MKTKGKRNKFTFLYSICIDIYIHIYLYIGGVEYCRIILHVLINKPRQNKQVYSMGCSQMFPFDKAQII